MTARKYLFAAVLLLAAFAASAQERSLDVIPYPNHVEFRDGTCNVAKARIKFKVDKALPAEGYRLEAGANKITVSYSSESGRRYALTTLEQMGDSIPCCVIEDAPRFGYRGLMLDCVRHFFGTDEIRKVLDVMAFYKLNTFHWHLTDDQGWRFEVPAYPRLTEVGAWRKGASLQTAEAGLYGGFYTVEEIADIVDYASSKGITVIPEVDLPGHMVAALASYPELGCTGGPYEVRSKWGIADEVLCAGNPAVYDFLDAVLDEVCRLFPGEYIHIGGDECPKNMWKQCPRCQAKIAELGYTDEGRFSKEEKLQCHVANHVQAHLAAKGRKVLGWSEIMEGDLDEGAAIMSWHDNKAGIEGAERGFDVVMTPAQNCYIDYYQSDDWDNEPLAIHKGRRTLTLENTYDFDPLEGVKPGTEHHILGSQVNLWTEFIAENAHLEYMLLPRMIAAAEVQWSNPEVKDFARFKRSLEKVHYPVLESKGYNYRGNLDKKKGDYRVCAFVWPSCHDDSLAHALLWPEGNGEWEVIKKGSPRYPGHYQPKQPLWGFEHDDDPQVVERWIDTAVAHGVNTFVYDWYWYNGGPFLEGALDGGFLAAANNSRMDFYIMWANHDVKKNYWNCHRYGDDDSALFSGAIDPADFPKIVERVIRLYFKRDNYVKIDGCPVFMVYDLSNFVKSFGDEAGAAEALQYFRSECRKAGFKGLHLQAGFWGDGYYDKAYVASCRKLVDDLGINSVAFYNMGGRDEDYLAFGRKAWDAHKTWASAMSVPVFPTVSVGWDDTPRFPAKGEHDTVHYNNTPEAFGHFLERARNFVNRHPEQPPFVYINAWNEWVESSYLLPDYRYGFGYLEAVKKVFGL